MAFPVIESLGDVYAGTIGPGATAIDAPAGVQAGDLLVCVCYQLSSSIGNEYLWGRASGWVVGTSGNIAVATRRADGTEGATVAPFSPGGGFTGTAVVLRVSNAANVVLIANSTANDVPSLTNPRGAEDCLWMAAYGSLSANTTDTSPTNYTEILDYATGGSSLSLHTRTLNAATEDPGVATFSGIMTNLGSATICIRPKTGDYPEVLGQRSGTIVSNSDPWTLTYPPGIQAGELLIAQLGCDGNDAVTATGWLARGATFGGAASAGSLVRMADGTETGNFSVLIGANEQGAWRVIRIAAGSWSGKDPALMPTAWQSDDIIAQQANSTSSTPDPGIVVSSEWSGIEDTLWLAWVGIDTSRAVTGYPSGWEGNGYLASGGSTGATLGWSQYEARGVSIDPPSFTIGTSDDWAAVTMGIRGVRRPVRIPRLHHQLLAH